VITWRLPVAIAALLLVAGLAAYFTFPRPPALHNGETIRIPDRHPADAVAGAAGWHWPDGVPGWRPGQMIKSYPVSGLQPVEVLAAQLAAARAGLDAESVRVVSALRPGYRGALAILAAHTADGWSLPKDASCLAAVLLGDAPVVWQCPGAFPDRSSDIAGSHVFVAATAARWPATKQRPAEDVVDLAGVARGDVQRVVLVTPGSDRRELYVRARTWGEFSAATSKRPGSPPMRLLVYGRGRLLEVVQLDLKPGQQRVLR
jgi:hypothetical protein